MIQAQQLSFTYQGYEEPAIRAIDITIERGEAVALVGPNGSGKSTLLRCLAGYAPAVFAGSLAGRVLIDDEDVAVTDPLGRFGKVAYGGTNPKAQLICPRVGDEIRFGLENLGLSEAEIASRADEVLVDFGLTDFEEASPRQLSGGLQKIVLLAALVALRTPILILDEPFANLDAAYRQRVRLSLQKRVQDGTTLVIGEPRLSPADWPGLRIIPCAGGQLDSGAMTNRSEPERPRTAPTIDSRPSVTPLLEVRGLGKDFEGRELFTDLSFSLAPGQWARLAGANGSGKTTLLRCLRGLAKPSRGAIARFGQPRHRGSLAKLSPAMACVFQEPDTQFWRLTVGDELRAAGPDWRAFIDYLGLTKLLDRSPFHLSDGEKRRLSLACALASRPALLLLDEPTTGLDAAHRSLTMELLATCRRIGIAGIVATHDPDFPGGPPDLEIRL